MSIRNHTSSSDTISVGDIEFTKRTSGGAAIYDLTSGGGSGGSGEIYYGASTEDLTLTENTTWAGELGGNNQGIFEYNNLTINSGVTLTVNGNHMVIYASGSVTINGTINMVRNEGNTGVGTAFMDSVNGYETNTRSATGARYQNAGGIAISAGGGGGGGSGNSTCDGGFSGDACKNFMTNAVLHSGGGGGYGGANSGGTSGSAGAAMSSASQTTLRNLLEANFGWNTPIFSAIANPTYSNGLGRDQVQLSQALDLPILMGGNGGPGGQSQDYGGYTAGKGGLGGGMVMILSPRITFGTNGLIKANGQTGKTGTSGWFMGGPGGGGGGGFIALISPSIIGRTDAKLQVNGGAGGYNSSAGWSGSRNRGGNGGTGLTYYTS